MSSKDEGLNDLLQCSICMEAFQISGRMKPKMLPCQHSFCLQCLRSMSTGMRIQCPVCRRDHVKAVDELPFNLLLLQIIDQKGPVAPPPAPSEEVTEDTLGPNDHIANLRKWFKSPGKAKKFVKQFQEFQQTVEFDAEHLSVILKCMEYYEQVGDSAHLELITDLMQIIRHLLRKAGPRFFVFQKLKDRLIGGVVAVMSTFKRREAIQKHGVNIFTILMDPKILGDHIFSVAKVVIQSLNVLHDEELESKVVEIMMVCPREVSREDNAVLGSQANIKNLLRILGLKLYSQSYKPTFHAILGTLMTLTDETPGTSMNIVQEKGLDLFEKLLQSEDITIDVKGDALIVVSNVAETTDGQKEIIKHKSIIEVLQDLMMSENRRISFISASVIAHLSVISKREWTQLCGVSDFRQDVLQKLYVQVSAWQSAESTNIKYRSFKPLYRLLQKFDSPPTQLYAAWTIRYFCLLDKNTYQEMLIREEALDLLIDIKENNYADPNVRQYVSDILTSIH